MRIICSGFPIFELVDFFRNIAGHAELRSSYAIGRQTRGKKSGIVKCRFFIAAVAEERWRGMDVKGILSAGSAVGTALLGETRRVLCLFWVRLFI